MKVEIFKIRLETWFMSHYINFLPILGLHNIYAQEHKSNQVVQHALQFIWLGIGIVFGWPAKKRLKVWTFEKKWITLDAVSGRLYKYNKETKYFQKIV